MGLISQPYTCLNSEAMVPRSRVEIIDLLKKELKFLERGGYGGALPWRPVSMFLDSPSCPNRLNVERTTPCSECWLFGFVPEEFRQEMEACHFIHLNTNGESVHSMSRQYTPGEVEAALKGWLEAEIRHLEELEKKSGPECQLTVSGTTMVENCVNPACRATFTHTRDGRIFRVERVLTGSHGHSSEKQNELYWLCERCSKTYKVVIENGLIATAPIEVENGLVGFLKS